DWAYGEYKGGCTVNQWGMGVSAAADGSSRAHSLLCTGVEGAGYFTSNLHTLDISTWNDRFGNHLWYDWDYGTYKGECGPDEIVVGLSQSPSTGALIHVRCASVGVTATNCRANIFPGYGDHRESPGDPDDWAYGYYKNECSQGSAVAGVSRTFDSGGAVHAILCCD